MTDTVEDDLTPEQLDARIAAKFAKLREHGLERGATTRKQKERGQHKKRVNSRLLRATGRDQLFTFRVREDLIKRCKEVAKERGEKIAAWMEAAIEAAIEAHEQEKGGPRA